MTKYSVLWTLIYQCTVNTISHKCTGDTKFGVRIVTNLGHQIWCPGDTKFFTVLAESNDSWSQRASFRNIPLPYGWFYKVLNSTNG